MACLTAVSATSTARDVTVPLRCSCLRSCASQLTGHQKNSQAGARTAHSQARKRVAPAYLRAQLGKTQSNLTRLSIQRPRRRRRMLVRAVLGAVTCTPRQRWQELIQLLMRHLMQLLMRRELAA